MHPTWSPRISETRAPTRSAMTTKQASYRRSTSWRTVLVLVTGAGCQGVSSPGRTWNRKVAIAQPHVEHAIEPVGLVREATDGVGLIALPAAQPTKVTGFAQLWTLVRHLPDHPLA